MTGARQVIGGAVIAVVAGLAILAFMISPVDPAPVSGPAGAVPAASPSNSGALALGAPQYEVIGDGPAAEIQYSLVNDETHALQVPLPWVKPTGAPWMSVRAQRGPGPGQITCTITGHGQVWAVNTAGGPYAVCHASAVPEKRRPEPAERDQITLCPTCIEPGRLGR